MKAIENGRSVMLDFVLNVVLSLNQHLFMKKNISPSHHFFVSVAQWKAITTFSLNIYVMLGPAFLTLYLPFVQHNYPTFIKW
jgi:hypothetical protein